MRSPWGVDSDRPAGEFVIQSGMTIESYPDGTPYPGWLVLGWARDRPIHAVIAYNLNNEEIMVMTVYQPDPMRWKARFSRRSP